MNLRVSRNIKGNKSNAEPGDNPQETMPSISRDCDAVAEIIQDTLQKEDSKNKKENRNF